MPYPDRRRFEGNPRSARERVFWLWDRLREIARNPSPILADAGAEGELFVARARLIVTFLILLIPAIQWLDPPIHRELWIGTIGATIAFTAALFAHRLAKGTLYRPSLGFLTSAMDVTLVSVVLAGFLLIDQPHTVVNSKIVYEIYFLALLASALRFDPRICAAAGLVAIGEYVALVLFVTSRWDLNAAQYAPYPYGMFSWSAQIGRVILLACGGVVTTALTFQARRIQWLSARDPLTGLFSRSLFDDLLGEAEQRARRSGDSIAVLLIGIDAFRKFNRQYGVHAGDRALRVVAATLRLCLRRGDLIARHGGDVTAVQLPDASAELATVRAIEILEKLKGTPLTIPGREDPVRLGFSAGLALFPQDGPDIRAVLYAAEARLRAAKESGGDRLVGPGSPLATATEV
jgi:diguanylate cyclase (GGDEF)-like protein